MKNTSVPPRALLSLAGIAVTAITAQAQLFTYNTRDVLLTFSESGKPDLEVDLGPIDTLKSLAPHQSLDLTSYYNITSQLLANFDNLDSLTFAAIAAQRGTGSDPANTSWLSLRRNDPLVPNAAPNRYTLSKSLSLQGAISGIAGDGSVSGALVYAPDASYPPSSSTALLIPTSGPAAPNSFTVKYNAAASGLGSLVNSPGILNTTPADFLYTAGSPTAFVISDLFEYLPGSTSLKSEWIGSFTFENNGHIVFTAVPEPEHYAAVFGAALAGSAFWLRRRQS